MEDKDIFIICNEVKKLAMNLIIRDHIERALNEV